MAAPDPKQELIALIADTFTVESLREFVRRGPKGLMIEGKLSWEWASVKAVSVLAISKASDLARAPGAGCRRSKVAASSNAAKADEPT